MRYFSTFSGIGGLRICPACDNMYVWINNALNVLQKNLCQAFITTFDTRMANTRVVKRVRKSQATSQSLRNGVLSRYTTQSTETESGGATPE